MLIKAGKTIRFVDNFVGIPEIPNEVFLLCQNPDTGEFFLSESDPFVLPEKMYGNYAHLSERYLNTFKDKSGNLGILLTGLKGTGKSLQAKHLCTVANMPTILIDRNFSSSSFKYFLNQIKQECIIFIDEFEKVYRKVQEDQEPLLSMLDGVCNSKKIFLFTANETSNLSSLFFNRPGRIYYIKNYDGLDDEMINEVVEDNLINKANKTNLIDKLMIIGNINMDLLLTIIAEMNRYNEKASESLKYLNIIPEEVAFDVTGKLLCTIFHTKERKYVESIDEKTGEITLQNDKGIHSEAPEVLYDIEYYTSDSPLQNSILYREDSVTKYAQDLKIYFDIHWDIPNECTVEVIKNYILITNKSTKEFLKFEKIVKRKVNYLTM